MQVMNITSRVKDYPVTFAEHDDFLTGLAMKNDCVFVIDSNVLRYHKDHCLKILGKSDIVSFPVSEERKNLRSVEELYDKIMERSAKKNMTLVSIGGGILQDITGFAATTLYRGINWIFVPTTLLAQADSCIGSKTSLNYKRFKNLIGTFYPPAEVFIYAPFLTTLEEVDFFSGIGEVVKLHIMGGDAATSEMTELLPNMVRRDPEALMTAIQNSLRIKQSFMEGDEFDTGRRNLLNFGHCFGHALETVSDYAIPHGQSVVIGMVFANIAAKNRALLSVQKAEYLLHNLLLKSLVTKGTRSHYEYAPLLDAMKKDKKRTGRGLVLVILRDDHALEKLTDFSEQELSAALDELKQVMRIS